MSYNNGPKIITDGLVLYLDAANSKSYSGTGTTWTDLSGNNYNGTINSGVVYSSANQGSFVFDGTSNSSVPIGAASRYLSQNFTLEAWLKSPGLGSGMNLGGIFGISYGLVLYIAGNGSLSFYNYNTDSGYPGDWDVAVNTNAVNLFDNNWHHIVATRNISNYALYIDSVQRSTGSVSYPSWSGTNIWSGMTAQIGDNPNDVYYKLKGSVGLAKIYNRALYSAEVIGNYNATKGRFGL
jgi:hypothetical protein